MMNSFKNPGLDIRKSISSIEKCNDYDFLGVWSSPVHYKLYVEMFFCIVFQSEIQLTTKEIN